MSSLCFALVVHLLAFVLAYPPAGNPACTLTKSLDYHASNHPRQHISPTSVPNCLWPMHNMKAYE